MNINGLVQKNKLKKDLIEHDNIDHLLMSTKVSQIAVLIIGLEISIFLWNKIDHSKLLIFLISLTLITVIRLFTRKSYIRNTHRPIEYYYRVFTIQMIISSLIWGLSGYFFISSNLLTNMFIIISITGVAVGGVSSLASDLKLEMTFIILSMLPFIVRLFMFQTEFYTNISLLMVMFFFLTAIGGYKIHKLVYENIVFKKRHKKNIEDLTVSENKFRSIFEHAPVGIFYYNNKLIISDCNEEFSSILETPRDQLLNFDMKTIKDQRILNAIKEAYQDKHGFYEGEYTTTLSNRKIWITMNCSPLYGDGNSKMGAIGIVQDRTEVQMIEEKVRHLAYHDNLTGLPNRMLLKDRIEQALSHSKRHDYYGAILFLDLDNFKSINDTLGHHVGDKILKETASRIKRIVRNEDTVARIGGDEFVIVLSKLHTDTESSIRAANLVASKIHKVFSSPFSYMENSLYTSTSIGIVLFSNENESIDDLLKNADTAMYEAKKDGRSCTHYYNDEMNATMIKRLSLENDLRSAIENREMMPYFQPIYNCQGDTLVGAETLLRWKHPELGMISPIDFIPLAEETNLIIPIGEWLIEEVCKSLNHWIEVYDEPLQYVSINISVNQLRQNNFLQVMETILAKYSIKPKMIVLEITENVLIGNFEKAAHTVADLRKIGIKFALDDFGTGYSSLTYLKKLELDILKIDRAFIMDIVEDKNDAALVEAILTIADNFEMTVVAEGVEELAQINKLKEMGCPFFQGYYFDPPLPEVEFVKLLVKK